MIPGYESSLPDYPATFREGDRVYRNASPGVQGTIVRVYPSFTGEEWWYAVEWEYSDSRFSKRVLTNYRDTELVLLSGPTPGVDTEVPSADPPRRARTLRD